MIRRDEWPSSTYLMLENRGYPYEPVIMLRTIEGTLTPWAPTHCDLFAADYGML